MLVAFVPRGNSLERTVVPEGSSVPKGAIWLDLLSPTLEEDRAVEAATGVLVPTREEMAEIVPLHEAAIMQVDAACLSLACTLARAHSGATGE